jgi:hypothetical protein
VSTSYMVLISKEKMRVDSAAYLVDTADFEPKRTTFDSSPVHEISNEQNELRMSVRQEVVDGIKI